MRRVGAVWLLLVGVPNLTAGPPVVRDPSLQLEQIAAEPDIVTPTGIAVDRHGRVWCLENHTHQRGAEYRGPATDRLRVFEDFGPDGRARKVRTFAEGFRDAMGLTIAADGSVYVATRSKLIRLRFDHDREVQRDEIVRLETPGTYPHNGLCGFAWDGSGSLIFGLGENLGEPYRLIGADGTTLTGGGEGGSMYRCSPDGHRLERIATGFWNPYAHAVNMDGQLFAVDNDPDARGPCRLLHVVPGGDYGYRFRYGRKGLHPFNAWNGEWPGTLPMAAGTSEAPSGMVAADFAALPDPYAGSLIVTSWGDHTIEAFHLTPRGASFSAQSRVLVQGDENFRPVALAIAPDGSIVFSDWVDRSYPVHGKGRIWRIRAKDSSLRPRANTPPAIPRRSEEECLADALRGPARPERAEAIRQLRQGESVAQLIPLLANDDPFIVSAVLTALGRPEHGIVIRQALAQAESSARIRLGLLLALRRTGEREALQELPRFLNDPDPAVRRCAIQWAAEEGRSDFRDQVRTAGLRAPVTRELLEAWVKADEMLSEGTAAGFEESDLLLVRRVVLDESLPPTIRALALRMVPPRSPSLSIETLVRFLNSSDELAEEAIRSLALRAEQTEATTWSRAMEHRSRSVRRWALLGMASVVHEPEIRAELRRRLDDPELRIDALRAFRGCGDEVATISAWWREHQRHEGDGKPDAELAEQVNVTLLRMKRQPPTEISDADRLRRELVLAAGKAGRPDEGERLFFHSQGPGCFQCHRIGARGSAVGPDLTLIGRSMSPERLIDSILDPNREVAPAYVSWQVVMRDGKQYVGLIAGETHDSMVTLVVAEGRSHRLARTEIEERRALKGSIMPRDVASRMTRRELADLLAFLSACK